MSGKIILDEYVLIKWNGKTRKHYEEKGYKFTKRGDIFKVKIEDVSSGSGVEINIKCPICGVKGKSPINRISRQGHTKCNSCSQKNKISVLEKDNYAIVTINSKFKNCNYEFMIDLEDLNYVKNLPLSVSNVNGYDYVMTRVDGERIALHRIIINANNNEEVDHKNHNTLDNRKANLRTVTRSQNQMNRVKQANNTSGYKGVSYNERDNEWKTYITMNRKPIFKTFKEKKDAIEWRSKMEEKVYGEFRYKSDTNE